MRRLSIAYDWQEAIIRAAISLKLSQFRGDRRHRRRATPTSIPEAPGSGRTWDYRYCWLRDAYFVVKALNRLGATQTMEDFISFILGIASATDRLRPVYSVVPTDPMDETIAAAARRAIAATARCASATPPPSRSSTTPMAASSSPRCRCSSTGGCRGRATRVCSACSKRSAHKAAQLALRARCRHLGISRPQARSHPFGGDVLGGHAAGSRRSRRISALPDRAAHWNASRGRDCRRLLERAWNADAQRLHRGASASTISTPACCCCPNLA